MSDLNGFFLVMKIGCLECDISSEIVGVFQGRDKAEVVAKPLSRAFLEKSGSSVSIEIFPMPELLNEVENEEFRRLLSPNVSEPNT